MALLVLAAPAASARPADAPIGLPTWADEFDGTSLDAARWSDRATGPRHDGVLTPDAISVGDGALTITTYTDEGTHYSGMIGTQAIGTAGFEQAYGWFEARMKFDSAPGQWSAFWLQSPTLGDPVGDPEAAGVEMDVAEHRARCVEAPAPTPPSTCAPDNDISDRIQHALLWDGYGTSAQSVVKLSDPLGGLGNGSWHTYALRWTPDGVTFYVDDAQTWSTTGPISRRAQYLVLSSEVGGFFAGAIPDAGYGSRETSTTKLQVDYVRVWATEPAAPLNTAVPVISGTPDAGSALACSRGSWTGVPPPALERAWLRDGAEIADATGSAYTVQDADRGHALRCRVTATNASGSAVALSDPVSIAPAPAAVAPRPPAAPPAPAPAPPPALRTAPAVDRAAPDARLSGSRTQRIGPTAYVRISCFDEPCRAVVAGAIRVPRVGRFAARTYRPAKAGATIARGARATVRLRLSHVARAAIGRALRARRRVVLVLAVRVEDRAANVRALSRRVAFKR